MWALYSGFAKTHATSYRRDRKAYRRGILCMRRLLFQTWQMFKNLNIFRLNMSHISFSLMFTFLLYVVCNAIIRDKIFKWFSLRDGLNYFGLIAFYTSGLCFFVAVFVLFAHRWTIKPLAIVFIIFSAVATYFISKYNVAIDTTMVMNLIYTDATEVSSLLSIYMLPYVLFLVILPILLVVNVNIDFARTVKYLSISVLTSVVALIVGVGLVYAQYKSIHRAANISDKYIIHMLVPINYMRSIAGVLHKSIRTNIKKNKAEVIISGQVTSQDDLVVVLVIGESSRQKNFSLYGYERRNTNPNLSKYNNLHILNGIASFGTTYIALQEILEKNDIKLPTITSRLGVDTSCYVNFSLYDNCGSVGEITVNDCGHNGTCYDEDVVPMLADNLNTYESGYRFVILHLGGGSHGPKYSDRHPPEFEIFKPMCIEPDVVNHCSLEQLYNSYDNTILYVDYVLDEIIKRLDDSLLPYVFIYLSDHGESLLEEDRIFHGMPPGIPLPPEQAQVPLIVKSSVPISIVERKEYSQKDIFDTILNLFSIETENLEKEKAFILKN